MIQTPTEPKDYCIVCNEVARRKDLSARAKGIYYYIATLPKNWGLSQKECMTNFTEGKEAFKKAFNELIEAGYITKTQSKSQQGQFVGFEYKVLWTSKKTTESRKTESRKTGNR